MKIERRDEYQDRADGDELFAVRGGQGRSAQSVIESAGWSAFVWMLVLAVSVAMVVWRATR